jgi:hypothetical protein
MRLIGRVLLLTGVVVSVPASRLPGPQSVVIQTKLLPARVHERPFNVTRHTLPLSEIEDGGVGRDEIPALACARFLTKDRADKVLSDSDRVLGVSWNGDAKAYPIRILNWHELVNDSVGGRPILVTW